MLSCFRPPRMEPEAKRADIHKWTSRLRRRRTYCASANRDSRRFMRRTQAARN